MQNCHCVFYALAIKNTLYFNNNSIVVDKLKSYSVNLTKPVLVVLEVGCLVSHLVGYDYKHKILIK